MTTFSRTQEALRVYDAGKTDREARFASASTTAELEAALSAETAAARVVSEAFAEDTRHINSRENAMLVHPDDPWLRALMLSDPTGLRGRLP